MNVTIPFRVTDNELVVCGVVSANYTSGKAVKGNATVLIQVREIGVDRWTKPPRAKLSKYLYAVSFFV